MTERAGRIVAFTVYGDPQAKRDGKSAVRFKDGRPVVHRFSPKKQTDWRDRVMDAAIEAVNKMGWEMPVFPKGAVRMSLTFFFPKPTSARKYEETKYTKPDADRLQSAVQDALQGIVYKTDAQVGEWKGLKKWATGPACVHVSVGEILAGKEAW